MSEIRFGFADNVITPELNGNFLDGYGFRLSPAESIRDDLHAKAMAVLSGDIMHLIFSIDLIGLTEYTYGLVAGNISAGTGVPKERIALSFIHTHSAPAVGTLADVSVNMDYIAYVADRCIDAAKRAVSRAVPCSVMTAVLPEELKHIKNRRGRDPIDRRIKAAAFRDADGELKGVICSASCHAVINTKPAVSADWLSVLNRVSTDGVPYLFLQGRGADINPTMGEDLDDETLIETLGSELADPVVSFAHCCSGEGFKPAEGKVRSLYEYVTVPMKPLGDMSAMDAKIKAAENEYFSAADPVERHFALRELQYQRQRREMQRKGETQDLTVPMQYFAVGDSLLFCFVPFEMMTLVGDHIEGSAVSKGWRADQIYALGYSNYVNGYLSSKEEFPFGGYEVSGAAHWYGVSETCAESADAVIGWFDKNMAKR